MGKKIDKAKATPWSQLQPSQVDVMTCDWLDHYERSLSITRKRTFAERVTRLMQEGQRNTLPGVQEGTDGLTVRAFLDLTDNERRKLKTVQLEALEKQAYLVGAKFLNQSQRQARLKKFLWQRVTVKRSKSIAAMLCRPAAQAFEADGLPNSFYLVCNPGKA